MTSLLRENICWSTISKDSFSSKSLLQSFFQFYTILRILDQQIWEKDHIEKVRFASFSEIEH